LAVDAKKANANCAASQIRLEPITRNYEVPALLQRKVTRDMGQENGLHKDRRGTD